MNSQSAIETAARLLDQARMQISTAGDTVDHARRLVDRDIAPIPAPVEEEQDDYLRPQLAQPDLIATARKLIAFRKARDAAFHLPHLFVDPAWEILLDLFVSDGGKTQRAVSQACAGAAVPHTTALRYLKALEDHALIERTGSGADRDDIHVKLSRSARQAIERILSQQGGSEGRHQPA